MVIIVKPSSAPAVFTLDDEGVEKLKVSHLLVLRCVICNVIIMYLSAVFILPALKVGGK